MRRKREERRRREVEKKGVKREEGIDGRRV